MSPFTKELIVKVGWLANEDGKLKLPDTWRGFQLGRLFVGIYWRS